MLPQAKAALWIQTAKQYSITKGTPNEFHALIRPRPAIPAARRHAGARAALQHGGLAAGMDLRRPGRRPQDRPAAGWTNPWLYRRRERPIWPALRDAADRSDD